MSLGGMSNAGHWLLGLSFQDAASRLGRVDAATSPADAVPASRSLAISARARVPGIAEDRHSK